MWVLWPRTCLCINQCFRKALELLVKFFSSFYEAASTEPQDPDVDHTPFVLAINICKSKGEGAHDFTLKESCFIID